jgi:hypothetical protein
MIYALTYVAASMTALYALWVLFLAVMSLKHAYDNNTISKPAFIFGYPLLLVGLTIDLLVNVFVASLVLLELPREFTVSDRLSRLIKGKGWRKDGACWFCAKFLDVFDPSGKHCK